MGAVLLLVDAPQQVVPTIVVASPCVSLGLPGRKRVLGSSAKVTGVPIMRWHSLAHQGLVGQYGTSRMLVASSSAIFVRVRMMRGKGGKAQKVFPAHKTEKASW